MPTDPSTPQSAAYTPMSFDASVAPASGATASCANCSAALNATYHMLGESMICSKCRVQIEGATQGGTGANRFSRAVLFGTGAAVAGAAIYYGILVATGGWSFAIIAILIGYMVGRAVNIGSHGKGGRKYQFLAAFLTYFAMSSTYLVAGLRELSKESTTSATTASSPASEAGSTAAADSVADATPDEYEESPDVAGVSGRDGSAAGPRTPASTGTTILIAVVAIVSIMLAAPILAGFSSPLLLVILGFGVYRAWAMNRHIAFEITGPFSLRPAAATPEAA